MKMAQKRAIATPPGERVKAIVLGSLCVPFWVRDVCRFGFAMCAVLGSLWVPLWVRHGCHVGFAMGAVVGLDTSNTIALPLSPGGVAMALLCAIVIAFSNSSGPKLLPT